MRLDRMIFERMETRILVGITMFVSIMVLVGWVAINENARMASFERQYLSRSIERGAYLFAANCATCHSYDGLGLEGRAPALNNPHLFGYDFLADVDRRQESLERERNALLQAVASGDYEAAGTTEADAQARLGVGSIPYRLFEIEQQTEVINGRIAEINGIIGAPVDPAAEAEATAEPAAEATPEATMEATPEATAAVPAAPEISAEERADLETERAELEVALAALETEVSALEDERAALEAELAGEAPAAEATPAPDATPEAAPSMPSEERVAEINARLGVGTIWAELDAVAVERDGLLLQMQPAVDNAYDPAVPSRLGQVGYNNTLDQYVYTTLLHGRPGSQLYWPAGQGMVAWGQLGGGPLRGDEIRDLTNYILNWDKGDAWTVEDLNSVRQFAIVPGAAAAADMGPPVGTDVVAIVANLGTVTGDPAAGETHYRSLGCTGCHAGGAQGPATEGTWSRVTAERLTLPQFAGYTIEQYLVESIVAPGAYTVPPYASGLMPANFGERIDIQMMADILAYLEAQG